MGSPLITGGSLFKSKRIFGMGLPVKVIRLGEKVDMTSNLQLDKYLAGSLKRFELLPAQSYDELFSTYGKIQKGVSIGSKNYAVIINMDKKTGQGTHWIAMLFMPGRVYYYDPLLPNKEYVIPPNIRVFLERFQKAGGTVYFNLDKDQGKTRDGVLDEMCGAYSAMAIKLMDMNPTPDTFFDIHEKLNELPAEGLPGADGRGAKVKNVFERIKKL